MSEHLGTPPKGENTSGKPANVSGGGSSGLSIGARPADVPGANLTPEEIARRASGRGTWHRRASKPVSHWMFTLVGVLLLHKLIPNSGWLMVHIVTLGLITNSILIWSQHFTEALMKIKIPDEHRGTQVRRIFILNAGILVLMIGMVGQLSVPGLYAATVVGALIVGSMVAWHGIYLLKQVRQALPSRFGVTIRFYIVAALLLPLGAAFGGMIAYPNLSGTLHSQFLLAHEAVNVLGFVGITVVGSLAGFLWWNVSKAQIFMGDSGSLALGGAMVAFALFTRTELLLLVIALIPVLEVFSVIVQKFVFKTSRKRSVAAGEKPLHAHRYFRMTPFHHHMEKVGVNGMYSIDKRGIAPGTVSSGEVNSVFRLWVVNALCVLVALALFFGDWFSQTSGVIH